MPAPPAPAHRAQTLKQAKAAYKSRNRSSLTEREKKQIERSIELDRRAWRAKEAEKRKAEAKAKREEKERKEREGGGGMTSQRRCDRYGFVGSQMHLGAFFGGGGRDDVRRENVAHAAEAKADEDEEFGGSLDDESMLDAEVEEKPDSAIEEVSASREVDRSLTNASKRTAAQLKDSPTPELDVIWDELDSSTQIARDLSTETPSGHDGAAKSLNTSFGSGDFDLSVEDIEDAQGGDQTRHKIKDDAKLMPPPALPSKMSLPARSARDRAQTTTNASTPARPVQTSALTRPPPPQQPELSRPLPLKAAPKSPFAACLGFTMAELESFVDDDLQLTQVEPV